MAVKKSRGWLTIVYPESCPVDWVSLLSERGAQAIISPLHDKDVNPTGEIKKPHYHVILIWDGPTTQAVAQEYVSLIGGVGCLPMASLRGAARYCCHLDNPEKAPYSPDDVRVLGGFDYQEIVSSASDDLLTLYEIFDWIDEHSVTSYRDFVFFARRNRPDWARVALLRHRENIIAYQKSLQWSLEHGTQTGGFGGRS